ncbi:MAG: diguanylate cyclase, partial [Planktotalea sp.]
IDLTELRPEFLTARPNLFSFFDQLRDNQVMPEPKNYASWRERIADMISAASDDNFNETWHLPNGLTYRISGRPHPDGAIAFLFEDISAEISLTRRFRSEASVTRSALDALNDSLVIFNAAGLIQQCNRPMLDFLKLDEDHPVEQLSAQDLTRHWQDKFRPSPVWGEIRDFISGQSDREIWGAKLQHIDGRNFTLQVTPIASGATLVTLSALAIDVSAIDPAPRKRKRSRTVAA